MTTKCTVLISSCDKYADILPAFFALLKKYWPNLKYDIALSTESTDYHDKDLNIINIHPPFKNLSWTERIYDALTKIKSRQVILLCDDFFLYDKVNDRKVQETIQWLSNDPSIASFTYWPLLFGSTNSKYPGFARRHKNARYKVAVIAGAWNKRWLKKYLKGIKGSAWQFEPKANKRSHRLLNSGKFYALLDSQDNIFPYSFSTIGLFSGKWLPDTKKLFAENKIKMDYTERGFYDPRFPSMQKSTQDAFSLESRILPNRYYINKNYNFINPKKTTYNRDGRFFEVFKLTAGRNCIRWVVTNSTGFSISNLRITINYADKSIETINNANLSGSFIMIEKDLVFNSNTPTVFIITKPEKRIASVAISGIISFPAKKTQLSKAYNKNTIAPNQAQKAVINQNWLELAISNENLGFIYLEPTITFYHQDKRIAETKEEKKLNGKFNYSYKVPKFTDRFIWNPSNSIGFYIKKLKIVEELPNGKHITHNYKTLHKYLPFIKQDVFCRLSDQKLNMKLNENCIRITISGHMIKPIPPSLMMAATNTHP